MKLRSKSLILALIGLVGGLSYGYYYADKYNRSDPTSGSARTDSASSRLPPDHPPISPIDQKQIAAAMRVAEQSRQDFDAQLVAARLLYQASRLADAAKFYQRAHEVRPDDYDTVVQLGNVHFDIGITEYQQQHTDQATTHLLEAARWYKQALEKNPNDVNVRTDYGLTYYYRSPKNLDQAIAQYRRSLQIQPTHPQTLANLTTALAEQGDISGARDSLARLERSSADTGLLGQALYNFTRALIERAQWDEADVTLAKLEKLFPNVPEVAQMRQEIDSKRATKFQPH